VSHRELDIVAARGFVVLPDYAGRIPPREWQRLEYLNWKSGGDTEFAPLASATGEMDCRPFSDFGLPDKGGVWTKNAAFCPTLVNYVESVGAAYGRVRVIKLHSSSESDAFSNLHLDESNNRLNPDGEGWVVRSWLELTNSVGTEFILRPDLNDPTTETRIPLHGGMQLVVDSQRLHHIVYHPHLRPRYALMTSWESGDALDRWINEQLAGHNAGQAARGLTLGAC
jgi:hypothetical protein